MITPLVQKKSEYRRICAESWQRRTKIIHLGTTCRNVAVIVSGLCIGAIAQSGGGLDALNSLPGVNSALVPYYLPVKPLDFRSKTDQKKKIQLA